MKLERWLAIILVAFVILISLFMLFNQDWIREHTVLRGAVGGSQSK